MPLGIFWHVGWRAWVEIPGSPTACCGEHSLEQVISAQPQFIRQFLHRTSILDWISAPFCDQILEIENSEEIIRQLDEGNLFLIPLDSRGERYRYHHLFAEVLKNRLVEKDPELASELYLRASTWHQEQGNINDAVEYAIRADAFNQAAELILSIVNQVIREGGRRRVLRWKIGVLAPRDEQAQFTSKVSLADQALATSGDYQKYYTPDLKHHHIIDPTRGYSPAELASATVVAPTGMSADGYATALMVLGVEKGWEIMESLPDVEALMVTKTGVVKETSGFGSLAG